MANKEHKQRERNQVIPADTEDYAFEWLSGDRQYVAFCQKISDHFKARNIPTLPREGEYEEPESYRHHAPESFLNIAAKSGNHGHCEPGTYLQFNPVISIRDRENGYYAIELVHIAEKTVLDWKKTELIGTITPGANNAQIKLNKKYAGFPEIKGILDEAIREGGKAKEYEPFKLRFLEGRHQITAFINSTIDYCESQHIPLAAQNAMPSGDASLLVTAPDAITNNLDGVWKFEIVSNGEVDNIATLVVNAGRAKLMLDSRNAHFSAVCDLALAAKKAPEITDTEAATALMQRLSQSDSAPEKDLRNNKRGLYSPAPELAFDKSTLKEQLLESQLQRSNWAERVKELDELRAARKTSKETGKPLKYAKYHERQLGKHARQEFKDVLGLPTTGLFTRFFGL